MPNFGRIPPRAPDSLGLAGLLGENCRIFYDNLFGSQSVGRLSDVLSAQLRELGLDEVRLRALLLFTFFEAYRASGQSLSEPLTVECGVDDEKVAVGITFLLGPDTEVRPEGIPERIAASAPLGEFEALLGRIDALSDHVLVRALLKERRLEIASFLAIPGRMESPQKLPLSWVSLDSAQAASAPAGDYIQVGDLDYVPLLQDPGRKAVRPGGSPPEGEVLARALSGDEQGPIRISGVTENDQGAYYRIKAKANSPQNGPGLPATANASTGAGEPNAPAAAPKVSDEPPAPEVRSGSATDSDTSRGQDENQAPNQSQRSASKEKNVVRRLVEAIFGGKSRAEESKGGLQPEEGINGRERQPIEGRAEGPLEKASDGSGVEGGETGDVEAVTRKVAAELQSGALSSIVQVGIDHLEQLKKESPSNPRSRWMEGFMERLMGEQRRLTEAARKAVTAAKQRQLEFRQKEQSLIQESRKKDELIHQKDHALQRAKEQLSQLNAQLQKFQETMTPTEDEAALRQKYQAAQRLLQVAKDESSKLASKVDQLKSEMATLQLAQTSAGNAASNEVVVLKQKLERMTRQYSQVKAVNEQLTRKGVEAASSVALTRPDSKTASDELKKRLEATTKAMQSQQRELEQAKLKFEESSRGEMRLKGELTRAQTELKALKAEVLRLKMRRPQSGPAGGGTGGSSQAA